MMPGMNSASKPRRIVMVAYPGVQPLDVVGPAEVFAAADQLAGGRNYEIELVARTKGPITTRHGGYGIAPAKTLKECRGAIDTLLIAGGFGVHEAEEDKELVTWVRRAAGRSTRIASVCSGTFLLAAAGLLGDRRVTTHWASCPELARRYPDITVDPDPIFVRDESGDKELWTSAGVTSGMDLALALVEEDLGPEIAREAARWLVVFLQRPGGQSQFSTHIEAPPARREPIRELQGWMADNLTADLRVETLADRTAMSPRNFARAFRRETGFTPAVYVEQLRVEAARNQLERGPDPVEVVAEACGFGTPETMRRAFARRVGVPPADYRARFRRDPQPVT
jgi:transcriptional regulator GlxA family with amidase domain